MNIEEPLTSNVRPATDSVLTIRIIKSFPFRNVKNHIIHSINLKDTTPKQLFTQMVETINSTGGLRPYRNVEYDTLKLYTKAHGTKSMNLVINFDDDEELIIYSPTVSSDKSLWECGIENETEISLFKYEDYVQFRENPEEKW